jgi:predicted O-methyltransferase YrrM
MKEELRQACVQYAADLFAPEDEILLDLRREIVERDMPRIAITAEEGRLLQVLLRAIGARSIVELGTLGGYSAIWMARALLPGGRLVTVEREAERAELARRYVKRAGLEDRVTVVQGEARATLVRLADSGPFDAVFIDADKESYPAYLEWCSENVRRGGLVIADNAFRSGRVLEVDIEDLGVRGIQEFNRRLARDARYTSIVVPTRDGMAIAVVN